MDNYTFEVETQLEEGLLDLPDITICFFDDLEGPCIETIENAHGYPIPRRKDYICIPSKPNDLYQVQNVVIYYNSDDTIDIEVYIGWVDITSVEL